MPVLNMSGPLPPLAEQIRNQRILTKTPKTPQQIADRLGRKSAKGLGRAFSALVAAGLAVREDDGSYRKAD